MSYRERNPDYERRLRDTSRPLGEAPYIPSRAAVEAAQRRAAEAHRAPRLPASAFKPMSRHRPPRPPTPPPKDDHLARHRGADHDDSGEGLGAPRLKDNRMSTASTWRDGVIQALNDPPPLPVMGSIPIMYEGPHAAHNNNNNHHNEARRARHHDVPQRPPSQDDEVTQQATAMRILRPKLSLVQVTNSRSNSPEKANRHVEVFKR